MTYVAKKRFTISVGFVTQVIDCGADVPAGIPKATFEKLLENGLIAKKARKTKEKVENG